MKIVYFPKKIYFSYFLREKGQKFYTDGFAFLNSSELGNMETYDNEDGEAITVNQYIAETSSTSIYIGIDVDTEDILVVSFSSLSSPNQSLIKPIKKNGFYEYILRKAK